MFDISTAGDWIPTNGRSRWPVAVPFMSRSMTIRHRIMIVGAPRSGTTLGQRILANHPGMYTIPETHYFEFMLRKDSRRYMDVLWIPKRRFMNFKRFNDRHNILSLPGMEPLPRSARAAVAYFKAAMDYNATENVREGWIEKTPGHLFYVDRIWKFTSDIMFVHIVRRPESVVASLVNVGMHYPDKWPKFSSVDFCLRIVERSYRETLKYVPARNHAVLLFDELFIDPERSVGRICTEVGLTGDSETIQAMMAKVDSAGISRPDEEWKRSYGEGITRNSPTALESLIGGSEAARVSGRLARLVWLYEDIRRFTE